MKMEIVLARLNLFVTLMMSLVDTDIMFAVNAVIEKIGTRPV